MNPLDVLKARGFVQQCTGEEAVREALSSSTVTYYVGFDPTADSLHVGHLLPIMAMAHLQRGGHRPIAVVGGGTASVGDPSGKTEMRKMLSRADIDANALAMKAQIERFLVLDGDKGLMVNNADWLLELNYIGFLREIGRHFSVNRMLAAEAYKQRLERGLSFIEFNYQLLQAYDFLELFRRNGCTLQMGGDDQWGNILAGTDLTRRMEQAEVHGLTFPLITTADGKKMGKTEGGAVWLDPSKTSPFDYFQYWLNVDDRDVGRLLKLYTFLPLDRIAELEKLAGPDIREAKRVLAREQTTLVHGAEACASAEAAGHAMVEARASEDLATHAVSAEDLAAGYGVIAALADSGLCKSRGEARRAIQGGGVRLDNEKVSDIEALIPADAAAGDGVVLRFGKKRVVRIIAG
ncbi:MAG: tyrosine--tRNA ligase [Deltaproteobacteria bacterium]|nr:MAG: tyrosine--tRNA ligase [Deltaproteobacteria bacterium]